MARKINYYMKTSKKNSLVNDLICSNAIFTIVRQILAVRKAANTNLIHN